MKYVPHLPSNILRVLAIDPGTTKTGVSLFTVDPLQRLILSINSWTISVDHLKNDTGLAEEMFGERFMRIYKLRNELLRVFKQLNVHYVAYEGPFMNTLQPSAYGPLVALQTMIHDALVAYSPGVPFFTLQPQQGKKAVGVSGKKGKDVIKEAVRTFPELMHGLENGNCLLDDLDDHAIDSIAVGFCALKIDLFSKEPK